MQMLRILHSVQDGTLEIKGTHYPYPKNALLVIAGNGHVSDCTLTRFDFSESDFKGLYGELTDIINAAPSRPVAPEVLRIVQVDEGVMKVIELLARGPRALLLRFVYAYCLGIDNAYFSNFLRFSMCRDRSFIEFIEQHKLKPWSVARFAEEFGLPQRKFNMLFLEKFGLSAKRWLMEQRLLHARLMLMSTPMRILDIALDCGFANHAHFTDSYRKRFQVTPTVTRLDAAQAPSAGQACENVYGNS